MLSKKLYLAPDAQRQLVLRLQVCYKVSERRAVRALGVHRSTVCYQSLRTEWDAPIRRRTLEIASVRIRYGYRRIHVLLQREGWHVNVKHVHRLYCLSGPSAPNGAERQLIGGCALM